jgi:hypothetical protein
MALSLLRCSAAEAAIECRDEYQVLDGQLMSTPYCNDVHLTNLANKQGANVTLDAIRRDPGTRDAACRLVGTGLDVCSMSSLLRANR